MSSTFMKKIQAVAIRESKRAQRYAGPDDANKVREASRERADKVRAPVSSYIHERNKMKYLVIKYGREEAARIHDARNVVLGR